MGGEACARRENFEAIFRILHPRLLRYAARIVDHDEAGDIAVDALARLWEKGSDIGRDPRDPQLHALAFRIASGLIRNAERARYRRFRLANRLRIFGGSDPGRGYELDDQVLGSWQAALAYRSLSVKERELVLMLPDGFEIAEIAAAQGSNPGAMRQRVRRLRAKLNAVVDDDGEGQT